MKKNEKYYPIVICGAFFAEVDLKEPFEFSETDTIVDITEKFKGFFDGVDFTQYPEFMKHIIMMHSTNVLYEEKDDEPGFYVGVPFYCVPDHFSVKRVCVDVRNLFINSGLIPDDVDPNFIKLFSKIIKIKET